MTILSKALSYASEFGFHVFPIHSVQSDGSCTCGNVDHVPGGSQAKQIGKHPATKNGLKDASADAFQIRKMFGSKDFNIGIVTGEVSGIFAVDVDGINGEESLDALEAEHGALPKTLTNLTGRGKHLIFKHPGIKIVTRTSKLGKNLDVRGDGGYIIGPPSKHASGNQYSWDESQGWQIADAPEWLIDLIRHKEVEPEHIEIGESDNVDWSNDDVAEMLSFIDPDCTYTDWIQIGMGLFDGGFDFGLFNNWSAKGSKYKGVKDCDFHWRSFRKGGGITMGTVVDRAVLNGYNYIQPVDDTLYNMGADAVKNILRSKTSKEEKVEIPLNEFPGIIGETVNWILSTAQKPQPELALQNTITALGAVFGRRYKSPMNTRTNIYTVGLAGTAAGKNHSKVCIKELLADAGLEEFIGGESIASGSGLLTAVFKKPSQIMHLDEFGMMMEAIMDKRGASHMKVASKNITELYSASSGRYIGAQYADTKAEPIIIASPNLCIFGISTMEKYTSAINRDAITSGELNRFIVLKAAQDNPKRRRGVVYQAPPEWLVNAWKAFKGGAPNSGLIQPDAIVVEWPGLQDRIDDMGDFEDAKMEENRNNAGALWGRYRENVIKIAMILAITENQIAPRIKAEHLDFAEALVMKSVEFMIDMVEEHLADSQHEKDCNDILSAIRRSGGSVDKSRLCRLTRRMDSKQREGAIISLVDRGSIEITQPTGGKGGGRRALTYSIVE
jgi:hypothetical protein